MPTATRITKGMILNAAFEIARSEGIGKVSNREIAKKMNCSIRPIYYQFKNSEELNKELYNKIDRYFYDFIMRNMIDDIPSLNLLANDYVFANEAIDDGILRVDSSTLELYNCHVTEKTCSK